MSRRIFPLAAPSTVAGRVCQLGVVVALAVGSPTLVEAASPNPTLSIQIGQTGIQADPGVALEALIALTVLSLVPAILLMTTSFIRIVIVLSFARSALGLPQTPPNQVLLGLALFLTGYIMWPVWQQANVEGVQAYLHGEISAESALEQSVQPLRDFMFRQTRQSELALFVRLAHLPQPDGPSEVPTHVLIPAFMLSELKTAFQMGFMILVPFLVIDLVVASLVMSLGMMMLPPTTLSLPFKVLLFVLADGWTLVIQSLVQSFH